MALICFTNKLKNIFGELLGGQGDYLYFCTAKAKNKCTRSSMDRIPDSGSDDMSSILIGCTKKALRIVPLMPFFLFHDKKEMMSFLIFL